MWTPARVQRAQSPITIDPFRLSKNGKSYIASGYHFNQVVSLKITMARLWRYVFQSLISDGDVLSARYLVRFGVGKPSRPYSIAMDTYQGASTIFLVRYP